MPATRGPFRDRAAGKLETSGNGKDPLPAQKKSIVNRRSSPTYAVKLAVHVLLVPLAISFMLKSFSSLFPYIKNGC